MAKKPERPFDELLIRKLAEKSWAPLITLLQPNNKIREQYNAHHGNNTTHIKAGVPPKDFQITGKRNTDIGQCSYVIKLGYDDNSDSPSLRSITLQQGKHSIEKAVHTLEDIPSLYTMHRDLQQPLRPAKKPRVAEPGKSRGKTI